MNVPSPMAISLEFVIARRLGALAVRRRGDLSTRYGQIVYPEPGVGQHPSRNADAFHSGFAMTVEFII